MDKTRDILELYVISYHLTDNGKQKMPLFHNSRLLSFTRPGIAYILKKYYNQAIKENQSLPWKENVHPHLLRHSKAVHMLESVFR